MPDPMSLEEAARVTRQHLDSLRAAGVEWLPLAPAPSVPVAAAQAGPSLFDDLEPQKPVVPVEERRKALQLLADRVRPCTRCSELVSTRSQTVFGVGKLDPDICFVGEAPGADEDRQGEPFVGQAGQLLNRIIVACGMKREEVYICNILRCRPPGNRTPLPQEAANCREYLERTLELVRPKFLCALGACAAQNLLGTTLGIGKLRGRFHDYKGTP